MKISLKLVAIGKFTKAGWKGLKRVRWRLLLHAHLIAFGLYFKQLPERPNAGSMEPAVMFVQPVVYREAVKMVIVTEKMIFIITDKRVRVFKIVKQRSRKHHRARKRKPRASPCGLGI